MKRISVLIMSSVRWYNASAHYALFLAEKLAASRFAVAIFGIPGSPLIIKARECGINVIDTIDLMSTGIFSYIKNMFRFRRIVKKNGFDIINTHISRDQSFAFLSLPFRRKHIIRTRTDSIPPKNNILNKIFYKISSRYFTIPSAYMVRHITRLGIPADRISVIPLEMNYKEYANYKPLRNLRQELNIPSDRILVSFIGRLDRVKGVEYFIRSYGFLKQKERFYYLISGEEINISVSALKELADNSGIADISFLGRTDDARDILAVTDIGIIPSIGSEAICRIGLEMLSFGIPIIGARINSIQDIVTKFGGILVDPGSPEQIAAALDHLSTEKNYKKIKEKIKIRIEKPADKFSAEYTDIFLKVLEK